MIKIEIIVDDRGNIRITGPIKDKILTLGILENAKFAVLAMPVEPVIQVPDYPPK